MSEPCPHCAEPIGTTDQFCEGCGINLRVRRHGTAAAAGVGAERPCRGCGRIFSAPVGPAAEYCPRCGLRSRDGTDHIEIDLGALAGVSDRGHVHVRNENAMALGHRTSAHWKAAAEPAGSP